MSARLGLAGIFLVISAVLGGLGFANFGIQGTPGRVLCLEYGLVFLAISLVYLIVTPGEIVSPISLFVLVLMAWFGARAVAIALDPESLLHEGVFYSENKWSALIYALVLTAVWGTVAVAVYHSRLAVWLEKKVSNWGFLHRTVSDKGLRLVFSLYAVGILGKLYRLLTGSYLGVLEARPEAEGLLIQSGYDPVAIIAGTILPLVGQVGLVLTAVLAARRRRWGLLAVVLLVEVAWSYVTAVRGGFISLGATVLLTLYLTGRISKFTLATVAPLGVVMAFAVVGPYRALVYEWGLVNEELTIPLLVEHIGGAMSSGLGQVFDRPIEFIQGTILSRFAGLDRFAGAVRSIWDGSAGLAGGETFVSGILGSFPRLFWPDRPTLNIGYWFPVHYLGAPRSTVTVIPMPRVTEFYVNFGLVGVVWGGATMGLMLRSIRGLLNAGSVVAVAFYVFMVLEVVIVGEKPFSRVFELWKPVGIFMICAWGVSSWGGSRAVGGT